MFKKIKMKLYFIVFVSIIINHFNFSQSIGANGVRSDSRINDLFEDLKNRVKKQSITSINIKGSPYFNESFELAEIEYFGKILNDKVYLRYNAYNDEMEMSLNSSSTDSNNILIKSNKVSCVINNKKFKYLGFTPENSNPIIGYLSILYLGKSLTLYERKKKIYMQATKARTSLERPFPARYTDKIEYYFSINNGSIFEIKINKKDVFRKLNSYGESIKKYLSFNKIKIRSKEDLLGLFKYLDLN